MGSLSAEYGLPSEAAYSASKFWVRGLTEAMNIEWNGMGSTCVTSCPISLPLR